MEKIVILEWIEIAQIFKEESLIDTSILEAINHFKVEMKLEYFN